MALRELTKEYLTKAVYHTPLEIVRLMAEALTLQEGTVLDLCGGSEDFLLRAAAMKQKKSEEELLIFEQKILLMEERIFLSADRRIKQQTI